MKCIFSFAIIFLIFSLPVKSQHLTVGDSIPDLKDVRFLKNGKYSTIDINFSEQKDKLIVFDFWSPGCAPCVAGLSKMDSLQKKFGNKIMIFPIVKVYGESARGEATISKFWKNSSYCQRSTSLGTIVESGNILLYKYFPNAGLPYEVWIKDGKVLAMTSPEYVNETEIATILAGESKNWPISPGSPVYKNNYYDYNVPLPRYASRKQRTSSSPLFYVNVTGYIEGLFSSQNDNFRVKDKRNNKATLINMTILELYRWALIENITIDEKDSVKYREALNRRNDLQLNNRLILEVNDIHKYLNISGDYTLEWRRKNSFCYETVLPLSYPKEDICNLISLDLNRFFQLNGRLEKRWVKCWVIARSSRKPTYDSLLLKKENIFRDSMLVVTQKIGSSRANEIYSLRTEIDKSRGWREELVTDIASFAASLNFENKKFPVLDESGYKGQLAFIMPIGPKITLEEYRRNLQKNGFDIQVADRQIEMLVVTENDKRSS